MDDGGRRGGRRGGAHFVVGGHLDGYRWRKADSDPTGDARVRRGKNRVGVWSAVDVGHDPDHSYRAFACS